MIKRKITLGIALILCLNSFSQTFTEIKNTLLPQGAKSILLAADVNTDGFMDLFMAGETISDDFAGIYLNNGDSTFFDLGVSIPYLSDATAGFADLNNDSYPDLLYSGIDDSFQYRFYIYINQQDNTFTELSNSIPGIRFGTIQCADMNHDGWKDIFISGYSTSGNIAYLYQNNRDLTFSESGVPLDALRSCDGAIADFDHNSYPDIVYSGLNESLKLETYYYQNVGDFQLVKKTNSIPGSQLGGIETCDVNNDGFADIAVFGKDKDDHHMAKIFRNNNGLSFTLLDEVTGIRGGALKASDFNNDGFVDIILTGSDASDDYTTHLFLNNSGSGFTLETDTITALGYSDALWLDFNNDHKNDILLGGTTLSDSKTLLLSSNVAGSNQAPFTVNGLKSETSSDTVWLSWNQGADTETASDGLTYDLFLYKESGNEIDFTPAADATTGKRYVIKEGAFSVNEIRLEELSDGKYWWSVQSVDAAYEGSPFATADTFYISQPVQLGNDTTICFADSISFSLTDVAGSMEWYRSSNPSIAFSTNKEIKIEITEKDTIWVVVSKDYGDQISDTIIVDMYPLPEVNLGEDTTICYGTELSLSLGTATDSVNWNTFSGSYQDINSNNFTHSFFGNDEIYVELTDVNRCTNYDSLSLTVRPLPEVNLLNDTALCLNDTLNLILGSPQDSINWFSLSGSMEIINSNEFQYLVENTDTFQLEFYDEHGCVNYDTLNVLARRLPNADAGEDQLICEGYSVTIGPDTPLNEAIYHWIPESNMDNPMVYNPTVFPETDTQYFMELTDRFGCSANDSVWVRINPIGALDIGKDTSICPGESIVIGGNPTASGSIMEYHYAWSPSATLNTASDPNPLASPGETTSYTLVVFTGDCPVDTLETTVTVNPLPDITIMNDTLAGFQEDITLSASGGVEYEWKPSEFLDNEFIQNPIANLDQTVHFNVKVTNEFNCSDTAGVKILVKNEVFIPELFTPNNDGINDYFKVYGFGIENIQLLVYNEQGVVVFESENSNEILNNGWNGEYKGHQVKDGKYFWKLDGEFYNGDKVLFKGKNMGTITILR